jgi:hypothetical protein
MTKRKRLKLFLGAMIFGMVICLLVLTFGDSRVYWSHRGPQPGDWEIRHWVHNVLMHISHRHAQAVDYNISRIEYVMTPHKRRMKALQEEMEKLAEWRVNFPWRPVPGSELALDLERKKGVSELGDLPSIAHFNHTFLEQFFEDEIRLTLPFKQFYTILSEHDRGHDPVLVALCFRDFRRFHHVARETKSKEPRVSENVGIQKVLFPDVTWNAQVDEAFNNLRERLRDWKWFHPEFATAAGKANANGLIHRLFYNMKGMEVLPLEMMNYGTSTPGSMNQVIKNRMREQGPLVPYAEWYGKYQTSQN